MPFWAATIRMPELRQFDDRSPAENPRSVMLTRFGNRISNWLKSVPDWRRRYGPLNGALAVNPEAGDWGRLRLAFGSGATRAGGAFAVVMPLTLALAGCASHDAPAIPLFNAFFPAWLLCAFFGVIGAVAVRVVFIRIGLDDILPLRLPVYVAVATIIGLLVSLFGFGR